MKVSISISIDSEFIKCMKDKDINPSKWVNEKMKEEFKGKEEIIDDLQKEIEQRQQQIDKIKKEVIEEEQKSKEAFNNLSKEAIEELKESKKILESNSQYFEGRYSRFKNLFNLDMSRDIFKKLLNSIK